VGFNRTGKNITTLEGKRGKNKVWTQGKKKNYNTHQKEGRGGEKEKEERKNQTGGGKAQRRKHTKKLFVWGGLYR